MRYDGLAEIEEIHLFAMTESVGELVQAHLFDGDTVTVNLKVTLQFAGSLSHYPERLTYMIVRRN